MDFKLDTILIPMADHQAAGGETTAFEGENLDGASSFVEALVACLFRLDELPDEAVQAYWLSYYISQLHNGGPAQFVFNSRWDPMAVAAVDSVLEAIGAERSSRLFKNLMAEVDALGDDLQTLLDSKYFGFNPTRDRLNPDADAYLEAIREENPIALADEWIGALPNVRFLELEEWKEEMLRVAETLPDAKERAEIAAKNEHWHLTYARKLSDLVHESFERTTMVEFIELRGFDYQLVYFLTDKGIRQMMCMRGMATMLDHETGQVLAQYPCPEAAHFGDDDFSKQKPVVYSVSRPRRSGFLRRLFRR